MAIRANKDLRKQGSEIFELTSGEEPIHFSQKIWFKFVLMGPYRSG